jgi:steroid delta-isomerase-like uncharacterized protein
MVGCQDKEAMAELEEFKAQAALEEQNKELVKRYFEEFNKGNFEIFEEVYASDYTAYIPSNNPKPMSLEEATEYMMPVFEAFPDMNWDIQDIIANGDKVIVRSIVTGTHKGDMQGIPATGIKVNVGCIVIYRLQDGKIVEEWAEEDMLGMMMQLGMELKPKEGEK